MEKMIAEFIKLKRKENGLTQKQLAEAAEVSLRTVKSVESAERVKEITIKKILQSLGYQMVVDIVKIKE